MVSSASKNGLSNSTAEKLKAIVYGHINVFRISLSLGPSAALPPLKINLAENAKPIKVRLRNYNRDQREFLSKFFADVVKHGMAYSNPTSR